MLAKIIWQKGSENKEFGILQEFGADFKNEKIRKCNCHLLPLLQFPPN